MDHRSFETLRYSFEAGVTRSQRWTNSHRYENRNLAYARPRTSLGRNGCIPTLTETGGLPSSSEFLLPPPCLLVFRVRRPSGGEGRQQFVQQYRIRVNLDARQCRMFVCFVRVGRLEGMVDWFAANDAVSRVVKPRLQGSRRLNIVRCML